MNKVLLTQEKSVVKGHFHCTQNLYSNGPKAICTAFFSAANARDQWKSVFSLSVVTLALASCLRKPPVEITFSLAVLLNKPPVQILFPPGFFLIQLHVEITFTLAVT
jgi:hypothetical protein